MVESYYIHINLHELRYGKHAEVKESNAAFLVPSSRQNYSLSLPELHPSSTALQRTLSGETFN